VGQIAVIMYKKGDIVAVNFPFSDLSGLKKRPAMVLSNNTVNQSGDFLLIQITSQVKRDGFSIPIEESNYLGKQLPLKSFVRIHKIFTLNESLIINKVTDTTEEFNRLITQKIIDIIS
jgi:mRNA interferase MazF